MKAENPEDYGDAENAWKGRPKKKEAGT